MLSHKWLTNILLGIIASLITTFGSIGTASWIKMSNKTDETADAVKDIKAGIEYNKATITELQVETKRQALHDAEQDKSIQKLDNYYTILTDAKHLARTEMPAQKPDTGFLQKASKVWAFNNGSWGIYSIPKGLPSLGRAGRPLRYPYWWYNDRRGLYGL